MSRVDPRLRTAVDASAAWYLDMFALHEIETATEQGLWRARGPTPPLHSAAKTLVPGVREPDVLAAVAPYDTCTVADSFGDLDLAPAGFSVLIDATWLRHEPLTGAPLPRSWERVADPVTLAAWVDLHGTPGVFPDPVLDHPAFTVLARRDGGELTAGAVVHGNGGAVTVAHTFGVSGEHVTLADELALAAALHPGLPVVGYATGAPLEAALDAGFAGLGPQRVWIRD
jgi:hypothetical protein